MTKESNPVGAPPLYKTKEQMQAKIDEYVSNPPKSAMIKITTKDGQEIEAPRLTISGLCYHLGFESRQSFYDYEKKPEFAYTVKRARLFIEQIYEQNLHAGNCTGSIFALKNMGWSDRQEIAHEGEIKGGVMVVPSATSVDDWEKAAKESQDKLKKDVRS